MVFPLIPLKSILTLSSLPESGVSDKLKSTIEVIMKSSLFDDFHLGGGTNLAIKYNHRISTDIDLFSTKVVGADHMRKIAEFFQNELGIKDSWVDNSTSENLSWARADSGDGTKIDVIQNVKLMFEPVVQGGIRLIHDDDIGCLKLLAITGRGSRKDFYDLWLLSEQNSLKHYHDLLQERTKLFPDSDLENQNIFNVEPINTLSETLNALGDFNKTKDQKSSSNHLKPTKYSPVDIHWFEIQKKWLVKVTELSDQTNLPFTPPVSKKLPRKRNGMGF